MAFTSRTYFSAQLFATTYKLNINFATQDNCDWLLEDYYDIWYTSAGVSSDRTFSYAQIKSYCVKSEYTSERIAISGATGRYLYVILTPKGAVEKGSIDLKNDFATEVKKSLNYAFLGSTTNQYEKDLSYDATGTDVGFSFNTTANEPYLAVKFSNYTTSRNISTSKLNASSYNGKYFNLYTKEGSIAPDFTENGEEPKGSVTVTNVLENCVSNVADGTIVEDGEKFSVTLTANPNYKFLESDLPTVYYDTTYGGTTRTMVISEDGKTAYAETASEGLNNLIADGKMTITGKAYAEEEKTPEASVTSQLSNCTASGLPSTITQGAEYEIAFTPSEGFEFKSAPYAKYVDGSGAEQIVSGTFTAESASLSLAISDLGNGTEVLIVAGASEAESEDFTCPVVNDLTNATCEPLLTEVRNGADVSLKLSPASTQYSFQDVDLTYLEYTDASGVVQKVYGYYDNFHSYRTITVTGISLQRGSTVRVHAKAYAGEATFDYSGIVHCTADPIYTAYDEDFAKTSHQQRFVADTGYFFNGTVSFTLTNNSGSTFSLNATYDADRTVATVEIPAGMNALKPGSKIVANAVAIAKEKQYDISTVFLPTAKNIYELSQKRYYTLSQSQGDYISLEQIDLGQYILSLRKMFVNLPSSDVQSIILGFYNTDITAPVFDGIKHTVTCGKVLVEGIHGNSLDFTDARIEASLPFVGIKTLEASKVMNRNIELLYDVNVTAGECVARIVDVETSQELYAFNGVIAYDIPYILEYSLGKAYQIPNGELSVANQSLYHVSPAITIRENDVVENEIAFGDETAIFTKLKTLDGFNVIDEVKLDTVECLSEERDMIREALAKGVYFPVIDNPAEP